MITPAAPPHSYAQVLSNRRLALFLSGDALSKIGDGMVFVALPVLVLGMDTSLNAAVAISLVFALPYLLPTAISLYFGLGRRRFNPRSILLADSFVRAVLFPVIAGVAMTGRLSLRLLIALLVLSSVVRLLSASSRRLFALELVPSEGRFAVNGIIGTTDSLGLFVVGPVLGGILAASAGPAWAILANGAGSLALLAATWAAARNRAVAGNAGHTPPAPGHHPDPGTGWAILRRHPAAVRLFFLLFFFHLLYGLVEVALPLLIIETLTLPSSALGAIWTAFGIGALGGALATNLLRTVRQLPAIMCVIGGWAGCVAALGLSTSLLAACAAFLLGGLAYGPFPALMYSLLQSFISEREQQPVFTLWAAGLTLASPLGLGLAGPLIAAAGPRAGLLLSAGLTALLVPLAAAGRRRNQRAAPAGTGPAPPST